MSGQASENVCKEEVYDSLFREHAKDLHDFLYYKFGMDNNPSDLVQEAFMTLWKNCEKVTPEKARSYLFTVANNKMLNDLARKKTALTYHKTVEHRHDQESPQYLMEEREYSDQLREALESLTEEQRVAFMLSRVEGKKHQEIADMLGISRKAVEKRIYKAVGHLKNKLGKI